MSLPGPDNTVHLQGSFYVLSQNPPGSRKGLCLTRCLFPGHYLVIILLTSLQSCSRFSGLPVFRLRSPALLILGQPERRCPCSFHPLHPPLRFYLIPPCTLAQGVPGN